MQPGFQYSSVLRKEEESSLLLPRCRWAGHMSCTAGADIEPTILPSGNLAVSTDIEHQELDYFLTLFQTQSRKGQKFKNPAAEQRSSPQGGIVRPETNAGQSSLGGI